MADVPEIAYAGTPDGVHIASQVIGVGPPDVIYANSFMGHIEVSWEYPPAVDFYRSGHAPRRRSGQLVEVTVKTRK